MIILKDFTLIFTLLNRVPFGTFNRVHAIVSDGLFRKSGTFYVMPDADLRPLEEIFRANVFKMLKEEDKIDDELINKLMGWKHSGFSVHNEVKDARDDKKGRDALAQYIIRITFSLERFTPLDNVR